MVNLISKTLIFLLFIVLTGCTSIRDLDASIDELVKQSYINGCTNMFIYLKKGDYIQNEPFESGQAIMDYCNEGAKKLFDKINKK